MTWTLCTSQAAIHKAGANANSTIIASGTALADYSDEAEAYISAMIRYDVVTNYSNLTTQGKKTLQMAAASLIAEEIIRYDPSGYTNANEYTQMLNVLENNATRALNVLREDKNKTYLNIST